MKHKISERCLLPQKNMIWINFKDFGKKMSKYLRNKTWWAEINMSSENKFDENDTSLSPKGTRFWKTLSIYFIDKNFRSIQDSLKWVSSFKIQLKVNGDTYICYSYRKVICELRNFFSTVLCFSSKYRW